MLIKTSNPMIKTLTGSTNHQIESKNQTLKGLKPFDLGGVGLGIVAALLDRGEPSWVPVNKALFSRNLNRTKQIPVNISSKISHEMDMNGSSFDEEYTIVTCHDPKESYTKVYFNDNNGNNGADEHGGRTRKIHDQRDLSLKTKRASVFHISPASNADSTGIFPASDFLSSCNMCQKKLHGHDIYMYRGEKAFCSAECRYEQMVNDERREKYYSSEASRQVVVDVSSSSPYATGQIYATGILAS